jgi:hypothetical protein
VKIQQLEPQKLNAPIISRNHADVLKLQSKTEKIEKLSQIKPPKLPADATLDATDATLYTGNSAVLKAKKTVKKSHRRGESRKYIDAALSNITNTQNHQLPSSKHMKSGSKSRSKSRNYSRSYTSKLFNRLHNSKSYSDMPATDMVVQRMRQRSKEKLEQHSIDTDIKELLDLKLKKKQPHKRSMSRSYSNLKRRKLQQNRKMSVFQSKQPKFRLIDRYDIEREKLRQVNQTLHYLTNQSRSRSKRSRGRTWDRLHAMSREKQQALEKNCIAFHHEKEMEELKECTFKPQITEYKNIAVTEEQGTFYERNQVWLNEREKKVTYERDVRLEDEK